MKTFPKLSARQIETILVALRAWQSGLATRSEIMGKVEASITLSATEIDDLCELINVSRPTVKASNDLPSYKTNDPKGWCGNPARGAALGRNDKHTASEIDATFRGKLVLQRVRLDSGGYDCNGTYFGAGGNLSVWWYASTDGKIDACLRALSRSEAKIFIRQRYPRARFYN